MRRLLPLLLLAGCGASTPAAIPGRPADGPRRGPGVGDGDGDGGADVDGAPDSTITYTYDGDALVSWATDYEHDGTVDARMAVVRDGGRVVGERYDCDGDGTPEEHFRFQFDAQGRKRVGWIDKAPGHAERCFGEDYLQAVAEQGEQVPVWTYALTLPDGLQPLSPAPKPGDGKVIYGWEDGRVAREEWDMNGDGIIEEVIRFVHDRHGNLVWEYHDDGPDGRVDISIRYAYGCWD